MLNFGYSAFLTSCMYSDFETLHFWRHQYVPNQSSNVSTNFGDDRSNTKKMAAVFRNRRWRRPPWTPRSSTLLKQRSSSEMKQHFSNRVVTAWNRLDDCIVTAPSWNTFKAGLSKLKKKGMGLFRDWCPLGPGGGYRLTARTWSCCYHRLITQRGEYKRSDESSFKRVRAATFLKRHGS